MPMSSAARALLVLAVAIAVPAAGCTRRFYRHRTDREVERVITEKNVYPTWGIEQWHVYPDGRARFADPSDPDHPPKPCDDPAAEHLSPNPQRPGIGGVGGWEGVGYLQLLADWDAANRADVAREGEAPAEPNGPVRQERRPPGLPAGVV